ncbi:CPBP family intramembrane metalloprotease [Streptococcus sanguinis]|jgi:hypothetical protein|nr:CPBP family intramembrane metalloprotease [Streptococcus sanguinis]MBZ2068586.1 CPBP family intramembrane metalloprotease [Streptococcus sanguinis]MBZ2071031.1 CPBP family intramembrane metalloprotease [Streptococcus sanguinis]RKW01941.1 MAG: CPBP family intramembrane metalloprotease [Streptococcus sp.]RSI17596.1 CAAX amino terminal protease self- immunity [Streptococcus sanguinis]
MKRKIIQYIYPIILLFLVKMLTTVWVEVFLNGRKVKVYSDLEMTIYLSALLITIVCSIFAIWRWGDKSIFKFSKIKLSYILVTVGLYYFLQYFNEQYWQWFPNYVTTNQQGLDDIRYAHPSTFVWGSHLFVMSILSPVREELVFRGAIMTSYFRNSQYFLDVLVSAAAFGIFHIIGFPWSWIDFFFYAMAGAVIGFIFRYTKSIYYPLTFHIFWNTANHWSEIWSFIYLNILNHNHPSNGWFVLGL